MSTDRDRRHASSDAARGPIDPPAVAHGSLTQRHQARPSEVQRAADQTIRDAAWAARPIQLDRDAHSGLDDAGVEAAAAHGISGGGGGLPYLDVIQRSFGEHDVSGVQAHVGGAAREGNEALGANAYATGNDVAFASSPSLFLVAHEAAHVVQQRAGVQLSSKVGQAGDSYEQNADAVATRVVAGERADDLLGPVANGGGAVAQRSVQRDVIPPGGKNADATPDECSGLNGPVQIGEISKAVAEAAGHVNSAGALLPELRNIIELFIKVANAGPDEQAKFSEQEKAIKDRVAQKDNDVFGKVVNVAFLAAKLGTSVASTAMTAKKVIQYVATGASASKDIKDIVKALQGDDTKDLKMLLETHKEFTAFAASIRADLGSTLSSLESVVEKIITGELFQAGIQSHFVTEELTRAAGCSMSYDAKAIAGLTPIVGTNASTLAQLAGDMMQVQALSQTARSADGMHFLKQGSDSRAGYDQLVETVKAHPSGLQMVSWKGQGEYLLMTEDVEGQFKQFGFMAHSSHFERWDFKENKHKLFTLVALKADDGAVAFGPSAGMSDELPLTAVTPLLQLGLAHQEQEGRPDVQWTNLPGVDSNVGSAWGSSPPKK